MPIFVLGIMPRSGTNFLARLLALHPGCGRVRHLEEDYLLQDAHLLSDYVNAVRQRWNPRWKLDGLADALLVRLGEALQSVLIDRVPPGVRPVTKTPSLKNIHLFPRLFPQGALVVITRDGPALVESGVRSFGWDYDVAIHRWATAARSLLEFEANTELASGGMRYVRVKYEELVLAPEQTLRSIFNAIAMDPEAFPYDELATFPVLGSSQTAVADGRVHWQPVERTRDFKPIERAKDWPDERRRRFEWVAGQASRALGYSGNSTSSSSPASALMRSLSWTRNAAMDIRTKAFLTARGGLELLKKRSRDRA